MSSKIQIYPQKVKTIITIENVPKNGLSGAHRTYWKTKPGEWGLGIWWEPWQRWAELRSQHKQLGSECSIMVTIILGTTQQLSLLSFL